MVGHAQGELLAQVRPSVTTAVTLFAAQGLRAEITLITVAIDPGETLSTAGQMDVELFQDDDGTTFDDTTRIMAETRLQMLQDSIFFQAQHPGSGIHLKPGGALGVAIADANDAVISVYGITESRVGPVGG
jgi:hypothetical protein